MMNYGINSNLIYEQIGEQTILLDPVDAQMYLLEGVANQIFHFMVKQKCFSISNITANLEIYYPPLSVENVSKIQDFIDRLIDRNIVWEKR